MVSSHSAWGPLLIRRGRSPHYRGQSAPFRPPSLSCSPAHSTSVEPPLCAGRVGPAGWSLWGRSDCHGVWGAPLMCRGECWGVLSVFRVQAAPPNPGCSAPWFTLLMMLQRPNVQVCSRWVSTARGVCLKAHPHYPVPHHNGESCWRHSCM